VVYIMPVLVWECKSVILSMYVIKLLV